MGDGFWNPADYVFNRYEGGIEQQKGKTLFGNAFTKNYSKIPQEAQDYINEQIQECLNSGYKVTKWFLRALESRVKVRWPDQVPYNWDISSFISTDKGMARAINKQNESKRVGNTQEQVANAKPGDTVLYNGKSVALSENDINKAQQNTGAISAENAKVFQDSADAFNNRHQAEKQESLNKASQMTEHEQALRENAQKAQKPQLDAQASLEAASQMTPEEKKNRENAQGALDEKNAQREQDWQNQQAQNQVQNDQAAEQAKQAQTSTRQSVIDKSVADANKDKWAALQQQSADINQNTIDEINQGSTDVGDIATAVSEVSMPTMNAEARPENLVVDERLEPVEQYMPKNNDGSVNFNGFKAKLSKGAQVGYNTKLLKQQIANRDKYEKGSAEWTDNNDKAKLTLKALKNYCEPWETNND